MLLMTRLLYAICTLFFLIYMVIAILCNCPENRTGMNGVKSHHTRMKCPGDLKNINALVNYMQSACPGDLKDMNVVRHYI